MDVGELQQLSKGLRACKKKGTAPSEPSKRVKVNAPSSTTPTGIIDAPTTTAAIEVVAATEVAAPPTSSSPLAKVQSWEPPIEKKKGAKKKKMKMASRKVKHKARPTYNKDRIELQELKIQMVYQMDVVKDTEAKLAILRKRLRDVEEDSRRFEKLL
ncbi:hypothetical protein COCNU_scaffold000669G000060 [Cocos nucifera]|nr:hypothetical protein [Cocos nucifera]